VIVSVGSIAVFGKGHMRFLSLFKNDKIRPLLHFNPGNILALGAPIPNFPVACIDRRFEVTS
jgi:hypothetical protein